jgi:hypothetical protein
MRTTILRLAIGVLALTGGCATAETTPSASVTTLMPDTIRNFRLSWQPTADAGEAVRLRGYVENTYGEAAARVQLLGQALNANGQLVGQRLEWVPGVVPGFGRVYFEIPRLPKAEAYRVTVWAYDRLQGRDGGIVPR